MDLAEFSVWSAAAIFLAEFFFWLLSLSWVRIAQSNDTAKICFIAGAIIFSDYISKYIAPKDLTYLLPALLGGTLGCYVVIQYAKQKKQKTKNNIKLVHLPKGISLVK